MKYIDQFQDSSQSFWDTFPYFTETKPFKELFRADRSKDKNRSSKAMWFMALICDIDSEFYSFKWEEQKELVNDVLGLNIVEYLGGEEETLVLKSSFEKFIDTVLSSDIRAKERKLLERQQFIDNTPYSLDHWVVDPATDKKIPVKGTASDLDKMVLGTGKLHDEIRMLREKLKSEQSESGFGGQESSFLESR